MRRIAYMFAVIVSLVVFPALIHGAEPTTANAVYVTPADVVAAAMKANREGDIPAEIGCLSPDGQEKWTKLWLRIVVSMPTSAPATTDLDKQREAMLAKYGVDLRDRRTGETDAQTVDRFARQIKDKSAFLEEIASKQPPRRKDQPTPVLENVQISADGMSAVAKLVRHDADGKGSMSMDVKFQKIDGSWKIDSMIFF
jgi:hypothetical protein